ncbi:hypothetical protein [Nocardia sp. NPDC050413]|uniref:hypothetical protein n=1 Tax=Nocardia sp. NPDC050413 TaxID=3155784 RepID=UPI00340C8F85
MSPRDDDLDDPFIARYADRITDDREVLWRADFARVVEFEDRGPDEDASLLLRAREIRARWSADPVVGPHWVELDEMHQAWTDAPAVMKRAHEVFMPGGLQPPGMSDTRWSSHMQAREMTGHGAWPGHEPTFSTDVSVRHEPMTETTDRTEIDEFATESDTEQLMRSDFTHWASIGDHRDPEDYDPASEIERGEWSSTWMQHGDDRWLEEWINLSDAYLDYRDNIEYADAKRAQLGDAIGPVEARSWDQARDLAVNGISRDKWGVVNSPYVTRIEDRVDEIRRQQPTLDDARRQQSATVEQQSSELAATPSPGLSGPMVSLDDRARYTPQYPVPSFGASVAARTQSLNAFSHASTAVNAFAAATERDGMER